jgi:hypothetical protein
MKNVLLAASVAALVLPIAYAADPPDVKEGLWSIHMESTDNPGGKKSQGTYSLCRDHAYDLAARARAKNVKGCTIVSETVEGGKHTTLMHCTIGASVGESKSTTTFQGDTATHSESHATYNPPLYGVSESTVIMDQKYMGSCPAGTKPGDRINADGSIMHLGKK